MMQLQDIYTCSKFEHSSRAYYEGQAKINKMNKTLLLYPTNPQIANVWNINYYSIFNCCGKKLRVYHPIFTSIFNHSFVYNVFNSSCGLWTKPKPLRWNPTSPITLLNFKIWGRRHQIQTWREFPLWMVIAPKWLSYKMVLGVDG